ncbi:MAG: MarR family winged helix-turn-helix transcriptional regulator [Oscillospiraceae bacterium]
MKGLISMLWEREDFIGNSFPADVLDQMAKGMNIMSRLNPANVVKGITASEFGVMCCVSDHPKKHGGKPVTVAEIAQNMCISVPAVSRTLRSLQEKGFIRREVDENDRRSIRVTMTAPGEATLEENLCCMTTVLNRIMSAFTPEEIRSIAELYSKFAKVMEQNIDRQEGDLNA